MKTQPGLRPIIARLLLTVSILGLFAPAVHAEIFASNRWLIVVETSRAMQRRAEAAQQIAASLAASGMNGQMRTGDTLGLWTFNDELHTGGFELQEWSPEKSQRIATRVLEFLRGQKHERDGRIERVSGDLNEVVKDSPFITVLIVSDGSSAKLGTPFDDQIAANFKDWQAQQSRAQMPFITVLRAANGGLTDFLVNTPPFPLELPELPENRLPKAAPAAVAKPVPTVVTSAPPAVPPLIISGRKPDPVPTPAVEKPVEVAKAETPVEPAVPTPAHVPDASVRPEPAIRTMEPKVEPPVQTAKIETPTKPAGPNAAPAATVTKPAETVTVSNAPASSVAETPAAVALAPQSRSIWLWAGLGLGIGIGATAVFLLTRKRGHAVKASLITRSLDRDQK